MKKRMSTVNILLLTLSILYLVGCNSSSNIPEDVQILSSPSVILYQTATPEISFSATQVVEETPTIAPTLSPTPIIYEVVESDTLGGIAFRFGISLNELMALNPDINPQFLSIGAKLQIPLSENGGELINSGGGEVELVSLGAPACIGKGVNGWWCYSIVSNPLEYDVDNVGVKISLLSSDENLNLDGIAYLPISPLSIGESLPATIYFPSFPSEINSISAELISALPVQDNNRYYSPLVEELAIQISDLGLSATWVGNIIFDEEQVVIKGSIAIVAYDSSEKFVGVNVYELAGSEIEAEQALSFQVFSIGGIISRVEIYAVGLP